MTRTVYVPATKSQVARQVEIRCYETWDYYYNTISGEYLGKQFVSERCTVSDDGSGGGDGGSGGGGDGDGNSSNNNSSAADVIQYIAAHSSNYPGPKPTLYVDRCTGAQGMWDKGRQNNNAEVFGCLTPTGEILSIGMISGNSEVIGQGIYKTDTGVGINYYYQYPVSAGPLSQTVQNTIQRNGYYYIPIIATIHTHTPCVYDGTDGVSNHNLSVEDKQLANSFPQLNNYIISCGAIGSFGPGDTSPIFLGAGSLSSACSLLQ